MLKKTLLNAVAVAFVFAVPMIITPSANAAELTIGYVDLKAAIENTKRYQNGFARVRALKEQKKAELDSLRKRINQVESDIMGQSMAMSPDRLNKKQGKLKELRKSFTRKQQDAQEELLSKKNALDEGILMNFYKVVRTYGKEKHYDMLLQKSAMFYVDPKYDITPEITKILDKKK
ncbi:MAG: OmpH family outer membrane protein [Mariprofundaceae bacterium]|nr:OmpH family outer membrane protein [Mariprofundaceae bacterium]